LSLGWSSDLLASMAHMINRSIHSLLFQRPETLSSSYPHFKHLLNSDLFTHGLKSSSSSSSSRDVFLRNLLEGKEKTPDLLALLRSKVSGRPIMTRNAAPAIAKMEGAVFAVLLHHSGQRRHRFRLLLIIFSFLF